MTSYIAIGALIGGFFVWYARDQKEAMKRRVKHPRGPKGIPDIHADSLPEDSQPVLTDAHPANLLGAREVDIDNENASVFIPSELTDVKSETLSLREWSTGRSPVHKELLTKGKPLTSAIPWVKSRSHVVAADFLKKEGLIPMNQEIEEDKNYFQLWPTPKQHPYQQNSV